MEAMMHEQDEHKPFSNSPKWQKVYDRQLPKFKKKFNDPKFLKHIESLGPEPEFPARDFWVHWYLAARMYQKSTKDEKRLNNHIWQVAAEMEVGLRQLNEGFDRVERKFTPTKP
jgi:hypothetical protein